LLQEESILGTPFSCVNKLLIEAKTRYQYNNINGQGTETAGLTYKWIANKTGTSTQDTNKKDKPSA
jgi:hypothetical protein